jgi:subtilisin family serine protease
VAGAVELHVAKVLGDLGEGPEQSILQGIDWALEKGCRIASMSLSAQAAVSPLFERVGRRALKAGMLLIAAAGNDSNRPSRVLPVGYPANSDSILAVAALDREMRVARFSNGGSDGGGRIDIAGPGVGVMSSWAGVRRYKQESGTSMATPFVAGIACLLAQGHSGLSATALAKMLLGTTRKLDLAPSDVGAGLVRAP